MKGHRASSFVKQATSAGEDVLHAIQDVAEKAGAQASDIGDRVIEEGYRARRTLYRTVEDRPLQSVMIAAAIGYAIARLLHHRR